MKSRPLAYWITTALVVFMMLPGGVMQITHQPQAVVGLAKLGYPLYFITLLGWWKVLGALAVLVPGLPRLKEWAYAGIFFDLTSAAVSMAATHEYGAHGINVIGPLIGVVVTVISWATRPASRRV